MSSEASDEEHRIDALLLVWPAIREEVARRPRTAVITESVEALHAESVSALFRFVEIAAEPSCEIERAAWVTVVSDGRETRGVGPCAYRSLGCQGPRADRRPQLVRRRFSWVIHVT